MSDFKTITNLRVDNDWEGIDVDVEYEVDDEGVFIVGVHAGRNQILEWLAKDDVEELELQAQQHLAQRDRQRGVSASRQGQEVIA